MEFSDISRDAQPSHSGDFQKKYDLNIETVLIHATKVYKAAKILNEEQKNIQRKSKKKKSRQLEKCMETYNENLATLEEAYKKIGPVLSGDIEKSEVRSKRHMTASSWNPPKTKERKAVRDTFNQIESIECSRCHSNEKEKERLQRNSEQNIRQLTETVDKLQMKLNQLQRKYEEEERLKEEALQRLSKIASDKLRDNNPNITDLSDPNRPTKIAEKMSELYDNEWTDAFDFFEGKMNEEQIIKTLLDTIMTAYDTCCKLSSKNFFERVQISMELPAEVPEIPDYKVVLTDQQKLDIKEFRKKRAAYVLRDVEKVVRPRLQLGKEKSEVIQAYVSLCVEIGWLCAVHDPPVSLDANATDLFDTSKFKDYTKRGKYVEFVVWPAMRLHKEGPLLSKGVAQGYDRKGSDTGSKTKGSVNQTDVYPSAVPDRVPTNLQRKHNENYTGVQPNHTRRQHEYHNDYVKPQTMHASRIQQQHGYYDHYQDYSESNRYYQYGYNKPEATHEPRSNQHQGYNHGNQRDARGGNNFKQDNARGGNYVNQHELRGNYVNQDQYNKSRTMHAPQRTYASTGYHHKPRNDIHSTEI